MDDNGAVGALGRVGDRLDQTGRHIADLVAEVIRLTDELRSERRWRRWAAATAAVLVVVVVGAFAAGGFAYREQTRQRALILDCVTSSTPGHRHPCNDRSARNTAAVVALLEASVDCTVAARTDQAVRRALAAGGLKVPPPAPPAPTCVPAKPAKPANPGG